MSSVVAANLNMSCEPSGCPRLRRNRACSTSVIADFTRDSSGLVSVVGYMAHALTTRPLTSISARTWTVPLICLARASGGYTGLMAQCVCRSENVLPSWMTVGESSIGLKIVKSHPPFFADLAQDVRAGENERTIRTTVRTTPIYHGVDLDAPIGSDMR